jgi:energy-coupling factor transport system ATP-binding protein
MLALRHVGFTYRSYGNTRAYEPVLRDISCDIPQGKRVLILGLPDSGKSTLTRIIGNLIPRFVEGDLSGDISINGVPLHATSPWDLTNTCTLVAQNPQEQLLMTTCGDEVAFPLESLGIPRETMVKRIHQTLSRWKLNDMIEVNPQELSGGERKRLLLAIADAIDAPLWIMDEPFDDLDPDWRSVLIQRIFAGDRTVVVCASRYMEEFRGVFDSYYLLHDGLLRHGSEEEIVLAFDTVAESHMPLVESVEEPEQVSKLTAENLVIVHPRRSVVSAVPFTLSVGQFSLTMGEIVALVGPNGAGKSTLSRVLCGLDPSDSGTISVDGKVNSREQLRTKVGYLFQNPDYGIFLPTVADELLWSLRHNPAIPVHQHRTIIEETAQLFALRLDDNPATMSYGARKHLQAAVYYILDRPFYIIDELDSGVTYAAAFEIVSLLRKRGAAIVLITHDHTFAKHIAQRQYIVDHGQVYEQEVGS